MKLIKGEIYYDKFHKELVEFVYMGQTGWAIVCEPGDSGGGMQSCWGITPSSLISKSNAKETGTKGTNMKEHRYISYFQSVLSIGVMTYAKNSEKAASKAKLKLKDKGGVNYCVFDQTDFELSNTEKWEPEVDSQEVEGGIDFKFKPDAKTKNIIATRLHKPVDSLTSDDLEQFAKESIERALKA